MLTYMALQQHSHQDVQNRRAETAETRGAYVEKSVVVAASERYSQQPQAHRARLS